MKTFVLMTKLATGDCQPVEYSSRQKARARSSRAWLDEIKKNCPEVRFKAHYALMGYWDSMHIYDVPDEETAAIVSLITRNYVAQVESWLALPYERVMKLSEKLTSSDSFLVP